ncbi:hypothetical protein ACHAW6_008655 [Cyclotella cf. meneghiniana]
MLDQGKDRENDTNIRGPQSDEDSNSLDNQTARLRPETEIDSNWTDFHVQSPVESASTSGPLVDSINDDMQSDRRHRQIFQGLNTVPQFTDEWFRLKADEMEVRVIMEMEDKKSSKTTHENINTVEPAPDRSDCLLPFPDVQYLGNVSSIKEGTSDNAFAKKTTVNPCNTIAPVKHDEVAKPKFKTFNLEQIPSDPSPVPVIERKDIDSGHNEEAAKTKLKRFNLEQISPDPSPIPVMHSKDIASVHHNEAAKAKLKRLNLEQVAPDPSPVPVTDSKDIASVHHNEAAKTKFKRFNLEHIASDPSPVPVMDSKDIASVHHNEAANTKFKRFNLEQIAPDPSPVPVTDSGEGNNTTAKKTAVTEFSFSFERSSLQVPQSNVPCSRNPHLYARDLQVIEVGEANEPARTETSTECDVEIEAQSHTAVSSLGNTDIAPTTLLEHDASFSLIPEAFLVEDGNDDDKVLAVAELIRPWWKRKRTYGILLFLALTVIAAALGISKSQRKTDNFILLLANDTTTAPSVSHAPSLSQTPSSRPSACVDKQSVKARELDFNFFNLTHPVCAIDGGHSVVVDIHLEGGISYLYVIFYVLTKYDEWDRMYHFVEHLSSGNDTDLGPYVYWDDALWDETYSVAMSRNTVIVGIPFMDNGTGSVFVYEYSERINEWKYMYDSMAPDDGGSQSRRFGHYLDIDDDLAVVYASGDETIYVFRREESIWKQTATFGAPANTSQVVLSGNTIAVTGSDFRVHLFQYDPSSDTVTTSQDPLELQRDLSVSDVGKLALSENHLAIAVFYNNVGYESSDNGCWNPYRAISTIILYEVLLYYRPNASKSFEMRQLLNSSNFDQGFGPNLALYKDILVVGGAGNKSNIFIYNSGHWEESLLLVTPNECGADGYGDKVYVSNRNTMVSTLNSVYIYDVDDCAPMPTSVPSSSPSLNPTTTCYWIEITVEHYHANEPTWQVELLNEHEMLSTESSTIIPTLRPTFQAYALVGYDPFHLTSVVEKRCLQEGMYEFTIFNEPLQYNLTSYGKIIVQGNGSRYKESAVFEIPF